MNHNEIYSSLVKMREQNPRRFIMIRVWECAERVESRFRKHGKDLVFGDLFAELNRKIDSALSLGITLPELAAFLQSKNVTINY